MSDFDYSILDDRCHRPWPVPARPWVMTQTWNDLLFAHWRIDPGKLRPLVPSAFPIDTFDSAAWIAVVPFRMSNVGPRPFPSLPWVSAFPELNVRTYVQVDGKPGVYFFSLDAANPVAVLTARWLLRLPYHRAAMTAAHTADAGVEYRSRRRGPSAVFEARYAPDGPPQPPAQGSLEYFLTERYCLYALDHFERPYRLEIHHPPWPLQRATADIRINTMTAPLGLELQGPPLLHFSTRQDVVCWGPKRLEVGGILVR